jgi:hypothetical protein
VILHFNPQTKAKKLCSEFCPEEEGISADNGLFHNALSRCKLRSRWLLASSLARLDYQQLKFVHLALEAKLLNREPGCGRNNAAINPLKSQQPTPLN